MATQKKTTDTKRPAAKSTAGKVLAKKSTSRKGAKSTIQRAEYPFRDLSHIARHVTYIADDIWDADMGS
jgi:hypothetical protein